MHRKREERKEDAEKQAAHPQSGYRDREQGLSEGGNSIVELQGWNRGVCKVRVDYERRYLGGQMYENLVRNVPCGWVERVVLHYAKGGSYRGEQASL